jgi:hypothetical protein
LDQGRPGVDVMITIFGELGQFSAIFANFCQISAKNGVFSLKKHNIMVQVLQKLAAIFGAKLFYKS